MPARDEADVGVVIGRGDLLAADVEALVNPVNTVGVMGKGLALAFKKAFPECFVAYERACRAGEVVVGRVHVCERASAPRFVLHLPTKRHWRQRSELGFVRDGLVDLIRVVKERRIGSIAVPGHVSGGSCPDASRRPFAAERSPPMRLSILALLACLALPAAVYAATCPCGDSCPCGPTCPCGH